MSLTISHAKRADEATVYSFHARQSGDYLWPRSSKEFNQLLKERQIFIVKEKAAVDGLCYTRPEAGLWEFGGIFLEEHLRGRGVAAALGRVAIGSLYIYEKPKKLIAHVHEFNQAPRRLLVEELGFEDTGEKVTAEDAPPNMRRNAEDKVVGDVFRFRPAILADFANWFDSFDGTLLGPANAKTLLTIDADLWKYRDKYLPALTELAAGA